MANPVWSLTNRTIDNRGTKSNPALTTATPTNPQGWETLRTYTDGSTVQYRIDSQGRVGYRDGRNGNQYANLQQFADQLAGEDSTSFIQNYINRLKTDITGVLTTRTQNTIPSAPPPATPAAGTTPTNTPGAAAAGPNADPDLSSFDTVLGGLQNQADVNGTTPTPYGSWRYPETIGSTNQDRVFIQMLKYVLPDIAQSGTAFAGALSNRENDFATKSQILGSVTLPMTNNLTESVEVDWGSDKLSSIAAGLMAGGTEAVKKAAAFDVFGALGGTVSTVAGALGNNGIAGRAKQYVAAKAAAGLVSGAGFQINPEAYLTRRTGTVPNPNLELLFNGPKLKAFGLVFKLTPRSEKEAHQIRNIIKFFKKGMAPIRGNNQENSFFLGTPNVFKIQFKSSDKSSELLSLPQFKTCALVTCGVNYTPDGIYAAYQDSKVTSQPISVTLQLGFSELTPVYNSDYEFPGGESVGPDRKQFERTIDNTSPPDTKDPPNTGPAPTQEQLRIAGEALLRSGAGATPAQTLIRPAN
jgi:hypothetical protein